MDPLRRGVVADVAVGILLILVGVLIEGLGLPEKRAAVAASGVLGVKTTLTQGMSSGPGIFGVQNMRAAYPAEDGVFSLTVAAQKLPGKFRSLVGGMLSAANAAYKGLVHGDFLLK